MAMRAMRVAKKALNLNKPEWKHFSAGESAQPVSTTYKINTSIIDIVQGDGVAERVGNRIRVKSLIWKGFYIKSTAANNSVFSCMVVLDRSCQGNTLDMTQVLLTTTAGLDHVSPRNNNYTNKYVVLWRRMFKLDADSTIGRFQCLLKFNKGKGLPINYITSTPAMTDVTEKMIFLVMWSNQATNTVALTHTVRYYYTDE